jgi:hypothetical protein
LFFLYFFRVAIATCRYLIDIPIRTICRRKCRACVQLLFSVELSRPLYAIFFLLLWSSVLFSRCKMKVGEKNNTKESFFCRCITDNIYSYNIYIHVYGINILTLHRILYTYDTYTNSARIVYMKNRVHHLLIQKQRCL